MAESLEKRIRTKNDYELLREASTDSLPNSECRLEQRVFDRSNGFMAIAFTFPEHTMDEPEKKRRRTEVDDGTSKEDVIVAIEHVKESFLNDLDDDCIDGIISYLKNEMSSEDVFVFSQVCFLKYFSLHYIIITGDLLVQSVQKKINKKLKVLKVNRRIYYRVAAHMKRKCNRLPIKRMDWADMVVYH